MSLLLSVNVGSTSLKAKVFRMPAEEELVRVRYGALGSSRARVETRWAGIASHAGPLPHAMHLSDALDELVLALREVVGVDDTVLTIAYKVVAADRMSGIVEMSGAVEEAMRRVAALYPAHNEPYLLAVRTLRRAFPGAMHVGVFETAFFDDMPEEARRFAIPRKWTERGIRRLGFHGASHSYAAAEVLRRFGSCRHVSCHLGGSSSVAAIRGGRPIGSTWGMSTQTGIPHVNRSGDFDVHAAAFVAEEFGLGWSEVLHQLSFEGGLKGLSGVASGDLRDIRDAACACTEARIALQVLEEAIVKAVGQSVAQLGGLDVLTFSGGIGENDEAIVQDVVARLAFLGVRLVDGTEGSMPAGAVALVVPTDEELMIARQAHAWMRSPHAVAV